VVRDQWPITPVTVVARELPPLGRQPARKIAVDGAVVRLAGYVSQLRNSELSDEAALALARHAVDASTTSRRRCGECGPSPVVVGA